MKLFDSNEMVHVPVFELLWKLKYFNKCISSILKVRNSVNLIFEVFLTHDIFVAKHVLVIFFSERSFMGVKIFTDKDQEIGFKI